MRIDKKEKAVMNKWDMMQSRGKKIYILRKGILFWGLPMGIWWAIIIQLVEEGFQFTSLVHLSLLRRVLIGVGIFSIYGFIEALLTWRRYQKKYSRNN